MITKIVSGGQTGADRGGLDAASELRIAAGGWAPRHFRAEDRMPDRYRRFLREHDSDEYPPRTARNVLESDATVVFYTGDRETGSRETIHIAATCKKPCCPIPLHRFTDEEAAFGVVRPWLERVRQELGRDLVLNVAGNRESKSPGIQQRVQTVLTAAILGFIA